MEIHPPEGPTHSFRDFLVHIAIVTVGILIALGLEGAEETWHNRHLVHETREKFRMELEANRSHIKLELENTRTMERQIDAMLGEMPGLREHPELLRARVMALAPSDYFFSSSQWQTALSTGALAHMSSEEVSRYAGSDVLVHAYSDLEARSVPSFIELQSFFRSHMQPTPAQIDEGVEKLLVFRGYVAMEVHVGEQLEGATESALGE